MVDNQHRQIAGYRDLSGDEIAAINGFKATERSLLAAIDAAEQLPGVNKRSLALARTNLQTGFMWLIRAIARPNGE